MRRRRRKSAFSKPPMISGKALIGVGAVAFVALFAFFVHQAKSNPPALHETSIALPDAFKD